MVWLVTQMWMGIVLAALLGVLLGWGVRGLLLNGRARKAVVDRDVALVELEQSRLEIDQLYAAQAKLEPNVDAGLSLELEQRESKLRDLTDRLSEAHTEIDGLKKKVLAGAAIAGATGLATAAAASSGGQAEAEATKTPEVPEAQLASTRLDADIVAEDASLEWKNRYLQSRVRQLEAGASKSVSEGAAVSVDEADVSESDDINLKPAIAVPVVSAGIAAAAAVAPAVNAVRNDKSAWQSYYLRQRFAAVQTESPSEPQIEEPEEEGVVAIIPAAPIATSDGGEVSVEETAEDTIEANGELQASEEIAAWRTDYLKQSLTYLEDQPIADRQALYGVSEAIAVADEDGAKTTNSEAAEILGTDLGAEGDAGELEQELARLRWRNRYLEGRLAYVSGETPATTQAMPDDLAEPATPAETSLTEGEDAAAEESELGDARDRTHADALLAVMDASLDDEATPETAELAQSEKPAEALEPKSDRDDLTRIEGVDAELARDLNALGIWHYHQIAAWTPHNSDWIDKKLGLGGAVLDKNWILQAGALSLGAELEPDS